MVKKLAKPSLIMDFPQSQTLNLSWIDTVYKNFHSKSILQFKSCLNFHQELFKCDLEKNVTAEYLRNTI